MHLSRRSAPPAVLFVALLAACGSSGGDAVLAPVPPPPPPPPQLTVATGPDRTLSLPSVLDTTATINASNTGPLTFAWSVDSGPGDVAFLEATQQNTRVTFSEAGTYGLRLEATDGTVTHSDGFRVEVAPLTGNVITVDDTIAYQTLSGWEATAIAGQVDASDAFANFEDDLFDMAVEDGINRVRLEVRAGAENTVDYWTQWRNGEIPYDTWRANRYATVNDNDHPLSLDLSGFQFSELDDTVNKVVLPMRDRLSARGERLFVNLCYVAVTGQITSGLAYHHDDPDEYAEFVLAVYTHLDQEFGLTPDAFEIILEPDNQAEWNGNLIGLSLAATGPRLEQAGYTPHFIAPSCTNMAVSLSYFDTMILVPGALDHLTTLSYHRYLGVSPATLEAIRTRAETYGLETAHLEYITATHDTLHEDLKLGGNSAWSQYALLSTSITGDIGAGYYVVDATDPAQPVLSTGWRTNFLKQYFRHLPAGAQRMEAMSSNASFDPLAFRRTDEGRVVVVKTVVGGTFYVQGLPEGAYGIEFTTPDEVGTTPADVELIPGEILTAEIPRNGVITIFAK